ncbi:MAG TPA: hypothetical protein VJ810_24555, partial [Blastocatellia bacterium]|nr:hypothetical protein [Blastocatellia bacterium]
MCSIFQPDSEWTAVGKNLHLPHPPDPMLIEKTESQYQQVKAVFRERSASRYAAFREALRIVIPYEWRRRAVNLARGRFGLRAVFIWAYDRFRIMRAPHR